MDQMRQHQHLRTGSASQAYKIKEKEKKVPVAAINSPDTKLDARNI